MRNLEKYKGVIPAFYACYDNQGNISPERIKNLAIYLRDKGVNGLYVGGSSGECIYQNVEERKLVLESVVEAVGKDLIIIAHIAANSTKDSIELAKHAESLNVDAIAAIPPIYFRLPEQSIEDYWADMIQATDLDFFIYNIPATTNYTLSIKQFQKMLEYENVIGVKNSSMPIQDIYLFKKNADGKVVVFNGPDEQYIGGRVMGADGGIGGTYGAMPELFLAIEKALKINEIELAREIQYAINNVIFGFFECEGNMYSVIKGILRSKGIDIGEVRKPLSKITNNDVNKINKLVKQIDNYVDRYKYLLN